jgi:DsbC/DsbD-like thiol-disulfide interchange protein
MDTKPRNSLDRRGILRALCAGAACGVLPPMAGPALAEKASPWAGGMHSRMRLAAAGLAEADGLQVAVIEMALDKGFKTYWRTPGDSGIPPVFSFDGSKNVRDVTVHFPPPLRFDDGAGGHSIGYLGPLVELPVTFRAIRPDRPVELMLKMDYAVCEKICVPASGQATLALDAVKALSPRAVRLLAERLPRKQALAAREPLAVLTLAKGSRAEHFQVEAALPGGASGDLFVEAANPWLFDARVGAQAPGGHAVFTVLAIDRDKTPDCRGVEVTLTLVSENRAIETTTWLDVALLQA